MMVCGHPYARRILTEEDRGLWLTVDSCPDCGQLVAERGTFEHIEIPGSVADGLTVEKIHGYFDFKIEVDEPLTGMGPVPDKASDEA